VSKYFFFQTFDIFINVNVDCAFSEVRCGVAPQQGSSCDHITGMNYNVPCFGKQGWNWEIQ